MSAINKFIDVVRAYFQGGTKLAEALDGNLADILKYQRARHRGVIPSARLAPAGNFADGDTVVIGGHTFIAKAALAAAGVNTQFKVGVDLAASLANLVDAINGTTNTNTVQATVVFAKAVKADSGIAGTLRIKLADVRGGTPIPVVSASMALSSVIAAGVATWDVADLNATGKAMVDQDYAVIDFTVSAAMATNGSKAVELGFTPTRVLPFVGDASNYAISGNAVVVTVDGAVIKQGDLVLAIAHK